MSKTRKKELFRKKMQAFQMSENQVGGKDYLKNQKDIQVFKEEPNSLVSLNIIPALVGSDKRLKRNDDQGVMVKGETWYVMPFDLHRNGVVSENGIVCPKTFGKKCPICELRMKKIQNGISFDDVKHLNASRRCLYFVQILNSKDTKNTYKSNQLYVWDISHFAFQKILNETLQMDADYMFFPMSDENGYSLQIKFSQESFKGTKFAKTSAIQFKERQKPVNSKIVQLAAETSIDDFLVVLPYEEIVECMEESPASGLSSEVEDLDEDGIDGGLDEEFSDDDEEFSDDGNDDLADPELVAIIKDQVTSAKKKSELKKIIHENQKVFENYKDEIYPKKVLAFLESLETVKKGESCPFGHKYGTDCDQYEDCDNCDKWPECSEYAGDVGEDKDDFDDDDDIPW